MIYTKAILDTTMILLCIAAVVTIILQALQYLSFKKYRRILIASYKARQDLQYDLATLMGAAEPYSVSLQLSKFEFYSVKNHGGFDDYYDHVKRQAAELLSRFLYDNGLIAFELKEDTSGTYMIASIRALKPEKSIQRSQTNKST